MSYVDRNKREWVVHLESKTGQIYKRTVHLPRFIAGGLYDELFSRAVKRIRLDRSCFTGNILSYHLADVECAYCGRRF